jgi:hypothetical protein
MEQKQEHVPKKKNSKGTEHPDTWNKYDEEGWRNVNKRSSVRGWRCFHYLHPLCFWSFIYVLSLQLRSPWSFSCSVLGVRASNSVPLERTNNQNENPCGLLIRITNQREGKILFFTIPAFASWFVSSSIRNNGPSPNRTDLSNFRILCCLVCGNRNENNNDEMTPWTLKRAEESKI